MVSTAAAWRVGCLQLLLMGRRLVCHTLRSSISSCTCFCRQSHKAFCRRCCRSLLTIAGGWCPRPSTMRIVVLFDRAIHSQFPYNTLSVACARPGEAQSSAVTRQVAERCTASAGARSSPPTAWHIALRCTEARACGRVSVSPGLAATGRKASMRNRIISRPPR